ncbi:dinitrogenase iron-molybdenum cofactor biosynthesis protein [Candidatus Woesearchaeota archaeon]|nr:dinitrogenase iron-molybdenum cofactor biosynthesis protein [Candidatus Woesearchaeota archaeon]
MKIAVSSAGQGMESEVDMRFGRCPAYVIVEIEDKQIKSDKTIENPAQMQAGGAGIAAAQAVGDEQVEAVITGNVGPNAFMVFQRLNIKVYQASGTVRQAVQDYIDGKLQEVSSPGPSHIGMGMGAGAGMGRGKGTGAGRATGPGQGRRSGAGQGRRSGAGQGSGQDDGSGQEPPQDPGQGRGSGRGAGKGQGGRKR